MFLGAAAISQRTLVSEAQGRGLSSQGFQQAPTRSTPASCLLLLQVMEELQAASVHSDERELLQLLSTPHLRVVTPQSLHTHTAVSPGRGVVVEMES